MNPRERKLALGLLVVVLMAGGAFMVYEFYLVPVGEREAQISKLDAQVKAKDLHVKEVAEQKRKVAESSKWSLPRDTADSQRLYVQHFNKLIKASGINTGDWDVKSNSTPDTFKPFLPGAKKEPFLTPLSFSITGHTDLSHVLKLLAQFYSTPLLHRITRLSIARPKNATDGKASGKGSKSEDLQVQIEVEALIVQGAPNRPELLPALPAPPTMARPASEYLAMLAKNIFYGLPPAAATADDGPDPTTKVKLTSITTEGGCHEVLLCDLSDNKIWYLYPDREKDIKDIFEIQGTGGKLWVRGEVTRVDNQGVVFRAGDKYYALQLGQTIAEALRKPLTEAQVRVPAKPRAQ